MKPSSLAFLLSYVWKTIKRSKGRTFFICASVSLAAAGSLFVAAFFQGMSNNLEDAVVRNNTGHYQIQERQFAELAEPATPMPFTQELRSGLRDLGIRKFSPELVMSGHLSTPEGDASFQVIGIDPALHRTVVPLGKHLVSGEFFNETENSCLIGEELARQFKLKIGEQVVVNYQDQKGELRSELLTISGVFNYSSKSFQQSHLYLRQADWQRLYLGATTPETLFHRIPIIGPDRSADLTGFVSDKGFTLKTWRAENPEMSVAVDFNDLMVRFCQLIILVTVFITIMGPVQVLWEEREGELRMLRILGLRKRRLLLIGLLELLVLFFVSALSSILFLALVLLLTGGDLDLNFLNQGQRVERAGIVIEWLISPEFRMKMAAFSFIQVLLVLFISYGWAMRGALKKCGQELR